MHSRASLTQKDKGLLCLFASIVGFGAINASTTPGCYIWQTTRRGEVEKLFELIGPWLSGRRRARATELIHEESQQTDGRATGVAWNKGLRKNRKAECHPDRPHLANGLCSPCLAKHYYYKKKDQTAKKNGDL